MKLILSPAKLMRSHQVLSNGKPVLLKEAKVLMQQLKAW